MRYAILGDIHANLEALETVLKDARNEQVTHYCCVGDVVGYGASPKECLEIIRGMNCPVVKGNHDEKAAEFVEETGFNSTAANAIRWTAAQLSDDERQWLRNLKFTRYVESFTIVHATLDMPQKWEYVLDKFAATSSFTYQKTAVCFYGHTHRPAVFIRDGMVRAGSFDGLKVEPGKKYFVNVGSIGQPRDGNPLAAYVIYDMVSNSLTLKRLPYDVRKAQEKILAASLPEYCATRREPGNE
jgi:predicted phosphodiesterase